MKITVWLTVVFLVTVEVFVQHSDGMKLKYKDCGSKVGEIVSLDVTPCTSDPCVIKRGGTNATATITFKPHEQVTSAKIYAFAIFGIVPVPLPLPNPDACQGHGLTCPLISGKVDELVITHSIDSTFPQGKVTIKAELKDQELNNVLCGEISLTLQ